MECIHIVTDADGLIVNRIVLDHGGQTPPHWHPGGGFTLQGCGVEGELGETIINGIYVPPEAED